MNHFYVIEKRTAASVDGPWSEPYVTGLFHGPAHDWAVPTVIATDGAPGYMQCRVVACVPLYEVRARLAELKESVDKIEAVLSDPWRSEPPVDLVLHCPACGKQHLDIGEFRTRVHRKHLCENTPEGPGTGCGHLWVPFEYATRGVLGGEQPEDS